MMRFQQAKTVQPERMVLVAPDAYTANRLKDRGFKLNDVVGADLVKLRNPKFNRKVHKLGAYLAISAEGFERCSDAHEVLKKLQLDGDIFCETIMVDADTLWRDVTLFITELCGETMRPALMLIGTFIAKKSIPVRRAMSLSFDAMDESAFTQAYGKFSAYIVEHYFPDMSAAMLEQMADMMPDDAF